MRVWIDCEFNEFKGELISIALIDEDGREFYASVGCEKPGAWVAEHVMPIIGIEPIPLRELQNNLARWLAAYEAVHLVADWPEDISHFCQTLITGPGYRLDTPPLTLEVRRDLDAVSAIPHNALEDVRAMRLVHLAMPRPAPVAWAYIPPYIGASPALSFKKPLCGFAKRPLYDAP